MARCVYLHIGTMKAATTYLQSLFDANRELLADSGLLWQSARVNQYAMHDFQGSVMLPPDAKGTFRRFKREIRKEPGDVLLSMELLAKLPEKRIDRLVELLRADELRVILTARDLTRVASSHWQESVQNGGTTSWSDWITQIIESGSVAGEGLPPFWKHHHLPSIVRRWSRHTTAPISVVTLPHDTSDPDEVWRRFASVIGVDPGQARRTQSSNAGLGATSAELMLRVNTELGEVPFQEYKEGFKVALAKKTLAARAGQEPKVTLSPVQHESLRALAVAMVDEVRDMEGVAVVGDWLDLVPPAAPPAAAYDPGRADDSDLLDAAVVGLAGMGLRVSALEEENRRLVAANAETLPGPPEPPPPVVRRSPAPSLAAVTGAKTVYLHIGAPKSGTSYLQKKLTANHDALARQGLLWPVPWTRHVRAARELRGLGPNDSLKPAGPWQQLVDAIRSWEGDRALISMEWLISATRRQVVAALDSLAGFRVEIIITERDLVQTLPAAWQEGTQNAKAWQYDDFVRSVLGRGDRSPRAGREFWRQHDLVNVANRWRAGSPDAIHLIPVPDRSAGGPSLWDRFSGVVGLQDDGFEEPSKDNASLGVRSASLVRLVNEAARRDNVPIAEFQHIAKHVLGKDILALRARQEESIKVDRRVQRWLSNRADTMLSGLPELPVDVVGDLEELRPGRRPGGRAPASVSDREMLEAAVDGLVGMCVAMARNERRPQAKPSSPPRAQTKMDGLR